MILFWRPDYLRNIPLSKDRIQGNIGRICLPCRPSPMALTILLVLYCPNPCVCAPLPEGRRVCHLARWHDPPENVLAPMSAPECGGWSERKRVQLTGYNGRKQKKAYQQINERRLTTSISVFEWPILHTIQLFFMRSKCSRVTTFLFPKSKGEWLRKQILAGNGTDWLSVKTWERGLLALKSVYTLWGKKCALHNSSLGSVIWF